MSFFKKNNKLTELFHKQQNFDISNTKPGTSYHTIYITLKPINACYYDEDNILKEFVIPRFIHFVIPNYYNTKVPVSEAVCIEIKEQNKNKFRKEEWFYKYIYIVEEELEKYSTYDDFEITIRRFTKKNKYEIEGDFEKIELKDSDFCYKWIEGDSDNTCAKIYDFYKNMDKEIIKAFGNGLYEALKTYKELKEEMSYVSSECNQEIVNYVNQIYDTALSMGENLERFPTILDYINIKNEEDLKKKQEELEKKRQLEEKQNQFIRDLKIRQSLLDDFNRPYTKEGGT